MGGGLSEFEEAVRSVFAQTNSDWQLLIVCDGSPPEIVAKAEAIRDPRVRVIVDSKNRGLAERLNQISRAADTDYVMRMDADDLMHPDRVAVQMAFLSANPNVDVLGSGSYLVSESLVISGDYREPALPDDPSGYIQSGVFLHPTVVYKRSWAVEHPYDPQWIRTEDKELWLRTAASSQFAKIEDRLLFYRVPVEYSILKQANTSAYDRRLVRTVGPLVAARRTVAQYVIRSYVKQFMFRVLVAIGKSHVVHASKKLPLSAGQLSSGREALRIALTAEVPGWPSGKLPNVGVK